MLPRPKNPSQALLFVLYPDDVAVCVAHDATAALLLLLRQEGGHHFLKPADTLVLVALLHSALRSAAPEPRAGDGVGLRVTDELDFLILLRLLLRLRRRRRRGRGGRGSARG